MALPNQPSAPPHDIYGPWGQGLPWATILLFLLVLLVFALTAWWLWRRGRRYLNKPRRETATPTPTLQEPPDYWRVWRELKPADPFNDEACREFFFGLSFLVKEGASRYTGKALTAMTVTELEVALERASPSLNSEIKEPMIAFLRRADEVKFRGFTTTPSEASGWHEEAQKWLTKLLDNKEAP